MKRYIHFLLALFSSFAISAQAPAADSTKVYFRQGHRYVDPSFSSNAATLNSFVKSVKEARDQGDIHHISVSATTSPDGLHGANIRLAANRCAALTHYIIEHTGIDSALVQSNPEGIAWSELRRLVAASDQVPAKAEVLDILDNTPVWVKDEQGKVIDSRKNRLMQVAYGNAYRWMSANLFPQLRSGVAVSLYLTSDVQTVVTRDAATNAQAAAVQASHAKEAAVKAAAIAKQAAAQAKEAARKAAVKEAHQAKDTAANAADEASVAAGQATDAAASAAIYAAEAVEAAKTAKAIALASADEARVAALEAAEAAQEAATEALAAQNAALEAAHAAATIADAMTPEGEIAPEAAKALADRYAALDAAQKLAEKTARMEAEQVEITKDLKKTAAPAEGGTPAEVVESVVVAETVPVEEAVASDESLKRTPLYRFAIKTNVLYDALLMPNVDFEWRINDYWSVLAEVNVAWWHKESAHKYYQIAMATPEVRRWFNGSERWKGWFAGAFAGGGKYDLENGGTGYHGEGYMAGLSGGYMWPIGKSFLVEASLGVGYMYSRYKEYTPRDGHYLYQRTKSLNYFGPLKAKVSIGWRFNDINKPKKVNPAL